jgi:hypothetical protein
VIFVEKGEIFQSFKAGDRLFIASAIGREQGQIVQGPDRVAIVPTKEASTVGQGLAEERFGLVEPTLVPGSRGDPDRSAQRAVGSDDQVTTSTVVKVNCPPEDRPRTTGGDPEAVAQRRANISTSHLPRSPTLRYNRKIDTWKHHG